MGENLEQVGEFSKNIVNLLCLSIEPGTPIYIGKTNIDHMAVDHPDDYRKYFSRIRKVIARPDYVSFRDGDGSVEFIKSFGEFVKVAVRVSRSGMYYARTLYRVDGKSAEGLVRNGYWKVVD